jgi:prepilin-type N-terminal cleavage/methylation domain-containing protein
VPGESRKSLSGLTLVELMVVLAVMGVLVSAALPSMGLAFADQRVGMAARDVVSLFARARYMSMAYGRAHRVEYLNDGGTGLLPDDQTFAFETLRGTSGACASSSFETLGGTDLVDLDCGNNWRCVDHLYSHTYDADPTDDDTIRVDGWQNTSFCYEAGSNNQVFVDTVLFSNWQTVNAQAGFGFLTYRTVGGNAVGVARKVLVPLGTGSPRILR